MGVRGGVFVSGGVGEGVEGCVRGGVLVIRWCVTVLRGGLVVRWCVSVLRGVL